MKFFFLFSVCFLFNFSILVCYGEEFTRSLNDTSHGFNIVKFPNPVRLGHLSQRFELRSGDCSANINWSDCNTDRSRTEMSSKQKFYIGDEKWISYSIYIDKSFKELTPTKTSLGQIHQYGGPSGFAGGFPNNPPILQFNILNNNYVLYLHRLSGNFYNVDDDPIYYKIISLNDMRNKWTDILIHIKFDKNYSFLEIYANGKKVINHMNNFINFEPKYFYFKYGIYNSFISRYENKFKSKLPTLIVFFDEIRIGNTRHEVDYRTNKLLDPID